MKRLLLVSVLLLPGCAIWTGANYSWPFDEEHIVCGGGACDDKGALFAYQKALTFCRSVHNHYERTGTIGNGSRFALQSLGAVAGTVLAPLTTGRASTAWSALSGATNSMQANLERGFSAAVEARRTGAVLSATTRRTGEYLKEPDPGKKAGIAMAMAVECAMAPGQADTDMLKSLYGDAALPKSPGPAPAPAANADKTTGAAVTERKL